MKYTGKIKNKIRGLTIKRLFRIMKTTKKIKTKNKKEPSIWDYINNVEIEL